MALEEGLRLQSKAFVWEVNSVLCHNNAAIAIWGWCWLGGRATVSDKHLKHSGMHIYIYIFPVWGFPRVLVHHVAQTQQQLQFSRNIFTNILDLLSIWHRWELHFTALSEVRWSYWICFGQGNVSESSVHHFWTVTCGASVLPIATVIVKVLMCNLSLRIPSTNLCQPCQCEQEMKFRLC